MPPTVSLLTGHRCGSVPALRPTDDIMTSESIDGGGNLCNKSRTIRKHRERVYNKTALKRIAAEMTSEQDKDVSQVQYVDISPDFLTTGRTGRRNALPDILGEHKLTTTADLSTRLQALTTNEGASTSNMQSSSATNGDSGITKTQNATC